jgi:hypothetical protein
LTGKADPEQHGGNSATRHRHEQMSAFADNHYGISCHRDVCIGGCVELACQVEIAPGGLMRLPSCMA